MNEPAPAPSVPEEFSPLIENKPFKPLWRVTIEILIGLLLISAIAYALPSRVKLFLLFPLFLGAMIGGFIAWARAQAGKRSGWLTPLLLAALVWGGQLGLQYQSYTRHWRESFKKDPAAQWDKEWQAKAADPKNASDPDMKKYRELLHSVETSRNRLLSFESFLEFRTRPLGVHPPWPTILATVEWLLCGVAAAIAARRISPRLVDHAPQQQ